MSNFPNIMGRMTNTPLLVTAEYLSVALSYMSTRMDMNLSLPSMDDSDDPGYEGRKQDEMDLEDLPGVAIISVSGALAHKPGQMDGMSSSLRSYSEIQAEFDAAMSDEKVSGILFDIDSPGGEAAGNFSLARHIAAARGDKPIWSIVDEFATSAAYNIAAATDRIVGAPEMHVGSIGVVTAHVSQEKMLNEKGVKVTFIHGGKHKVDGNSAQDLPDDVRDDIQARINSTYKNFVSTVAQNRGLQAGDIRATEARIYSGSDALDRGLVDELLSADEAFADFCEHCTGASQSTTGNAMSGNKSAAQGAELTVSTLEAENVQLKETVESQKTELTTLASKFEILESKQVADKAESDTQSMKDSIQKGIDIERARVVGIVKLESANLSPNHGEMALEYCDMGMSIEQADTLLKKMSVPEPSDDEVDALGDAMKKEIKPGEEVDANLSGNGELDEVAEAIADSLRFKSETAGFINDYAEAK